jgi:uncharacterized protein YcfJ
MGQAERLRKTYEANAAVVPPPVVTSLVPSRVIDKTSRLVKVRVKGYKAPKVPAANYRNAYRGAGTILGGLSGALMGGQKAGTAGAVLGGIGGAIAGHTVGHVIDYTADKSRTAITKRQRLKKIKTPAVANFWSDESRAAALAARKAKFAGEGNTNHQFGHHAKMAADHQLQAKTARQNGDIKDALDHDVMAKMHQAQDNDPKYHKAESEYHFRKEAELKRAGLHPGFVGPAAGFLTGGVGGAKLGAIAGGAALPIVGAPAGSIIGASIGAPAGAVAASKIHRIKSNLEAAKHASLGNKHLEKIKELTGKST